jgi:CRISPR/Cas system Type II protein with McrA/HNH and RuvC-like nuclease domain
MRGMRRNKDRKNERYKDLIEYLKSFDFINEVNNQEIFSVNPYEARSIAIEEGAYQKYCIRAILHLCKRRGYQSCVN